MNLKTAHTRIHTHIHDVKMSGQVHAHGHVDAHTRMRIQYPHTLMLILIY